MTRLISASSLHHNYRDIYELRADVCELARCIWDARLYAERVRYMLDAQILWRIALKHGRELDYCQAVGRTLDAWLVRRVIPEPA